MNELIQTIQVLNEEELEIINSYIDTLIFYDNHIFDSGSRVDDDSLVYTSPL